MIIGFDGNEANAQPRVGIGSYAYSVLSGMAKLLGEDKLEVYLKSSPLADMPHNASVKYDVFGPPTFWTQFALPLKIYSEKKKLDVFFSPSHYSPRFSSVPTAISVMDLSYLFFPETFAKKDLFQLKNWTSYSVKKSKAIFTISQASRSDIIKEYKVKENKVFVTYPGIRRIPTLKPVIYPAKMLKEKYNITDKYFLFVGTLQPRKNITRLIEAFSMLKKKKGNDDFQLVIVGKKGWLYEEILQSPEKYGVSDSVIFIDFAPDEDLPALYRNAVCFVLPSLYEGFGLPILEAMENDCPVITSNVSSMPEAGGDAAQYVDPNDAEDIYKKMELVYEDDSLRKKMIEKGRDQVKKFSWEKTARQTLDVLRSLEHER